MNLLDQTTFDHSVEEKVRHHADAIYRRTDRLFAILMPLQWIGGIVAALVISPWTWIGAHGQVHPHVLFAVIGGALLCSLPVALALTRPGKLSTRTVIACSQILFSSLLIHLTGGRIETHFHVFGSLAFLAAYRDWRVLIPSTIIVAVDHFVRGVWWPETVFGIATASEWRWLEHAAWVVFEDIFLLVLIRQSVSEVYDLARNTTQVERTAEELSYSAQQIRKLSLVASHARDGVVIADGEGRAEWVNVTFTEMNGYSPEEIIGKEPWPLLEGPRTDPETAQHIREQLQRAEGASEEVIIYTKEGREFWSSFKIAPVHNDAGELTNFIFTQSDISTRKAREDELRRAKEESESANRAKSLFLANMSHEIRTPLNGILGFTDLLRRSGRGIPEAERDEYLQTISSSGRHLLTLINDILDISKIEAGHLHVEFMPCSPHKIVADVVSVLRVPAREKGVTLDYRWESGVPESITTDPHRLKQLLINLAGNAIKFTDQGSVLIVAALDTSGKRPNLHLEVRDTGAGIPPDKLNVIFEPFAQADESITRKHGGTGLGLAISRRIAEALGGTLHVSSEVGRGSIFTATVTTGDLSGVRILEKPPEYTVGDVTGQDMVHRNMEGLNILLVEDGDTNRRLISVALSRCGARVVSADHGKIALQFAMEESFDLVLMDMQMPVMDGYTATRTLRDRGFAGPIIALTAHAMKGDRERCAEAGCSGYLSKPINMDELIRVVLETTQRAATRPHPFASVSSNGQSSAFPSIPERLQSSLPTDDPEIRSIVSEFRVKLPVEIEKMDAARCQEQYDELARLAHWLKGAGGTVGYDCFTEPAMQLKTFAAEKNAIKIGDTIQHLRQLEKVLVV